MSPGSASPEIVRITGALVEARPLPGAALYELARVGERGLLAEVVRVDGDAATLQVYEDTDGLRLGEPVALTGGPLSAELGPGLLGAVLDGVGRPLPRLAEATGDRLGAGVAAPTLDPARRWSFAAALAPGARAAPGDLLGTVAETPGVLHRVLVPPGVSGTVAALASGDFTVGEPVGALADGTPLTLAQRWPVRRPRPVAERLPAGRPLITGQRVFDLLFPVALGGTVAVPGGFGTGKTLIEQALAKHAEADVIVYVGCGERGNEMAEVLAEFGRLTDPRSGRPLLERTVLVVNTSNMPVAAREASVELALTIAEYYRDMGLSVAVMADSLSRWAEALREIAARLAEMPGEEGYPATLASRLGKLFERAGRARPLGTPAREGAVTLIAAVSPPGGDFSEPVTQACLRVAGALWALDAALAHRRHFPAVDWQTSYSLYAAATLPGFAERAGPGWGELRARTLDLLAREAELQEIAGLVGAEALQESDRLLLEGARAVREAVLAQSAFDPWDAASPPARTYRLATLAHDLCAAGVAAVAAGVPFGEVRFGPARQALAALRGLPPAELEAAAGRLEATIAGLRRAGRAAAGTGEDGAQLSEPGRPAGPEGEFEHHPQPGPVRRGAAGGGP